MAEIPFTKLLDLMSRQKACEELSLIPGEVVTVRLNDGIVVRLDTKRQTVEGIDECLRSVIPARSQQELDADEHTEFLVDYNENERFRVVVSGQADGVRVVIRRS